MKKAIITAKTLTASDIVRQIKAASFVMMSMCMMMYVHTAFLT